MRVAYMDEAGTSALEPESVIVAIVVDPDKQWRSAKDEIDRVLDRWCPPELRSEFIFHAKDVFGGGKYREIWPLEQRLMLLQAFVSIPRRLGLPICYARTRRGASSTALKDVDSFNTTLKPHEIDHVMTFMNCIAAIDRYMRRRLGPNEIGMIVAEDVDKIRKTLRAIPQALRKQSLHLPPDHIRMDVSGVSPDVAIQGVDVKVSRIIDCAHFAGKTEAPLLQLADACAFSIRRYLGKQKHGDFLINAMLGHLLNLDDFTGEASFGTWLADWRPSLLKFR